ncbi:hypothetical protein [Yoonia sp. 208BN28-4]|uniref:hypothetical protein n=1 Tax=Yoonia sp. 208BN28-4 TaxID=3126505 RepID=UPI0030B096BD
MNFFGHKIGSATTAIVLLTACGGANSPSFGGYATDAYAAFRSNGINKISDTDLDTSAMALPVSGSAELDGYIGMLIVPDGGTPRQLRTPADVDALGLFSFTASLTPAGGTYSAVADEFIGRSGEEYAGELVSTGTLTREPANASRPDGSIDISGNLSGTLTGTGLVNGVYSNGDLDGTVFEDGELIIGFGEADFDAAIGGATDNAVFAYILEDD